MVVVAIILANLGVLREEETVAAAVSLTPAQLQDLAVLHLKALLVVGILAVRLETTRAIQIGTAVVVEEGATTAVLRVKVVRCIKSVFAMAVVEEAPASVTLAI
jgi:hypothetical protein